MDESFLRKYFELRARYVLCPSWICAHCKQYIIVSCISGRQLFRTSWSVSFKQKCQAVYSAAVESLTVSEYERQTLRTKWKCVQSVEVSHYGSCTLYTDNVPHFARHATNPFQNEIVTIALCVARSRRHQSNTLLPSAKCGPNAMQSFK